MVEENEMSAAQKKLFQLRMRVNAGRKANKKELIAEHDRVVQSTKKHDTSQSSETREEKERKRKKIDESVHLNESAECVEQQMKKQQKKDKRRAAFGWDVFNQDSLYKAYKKRLQNLPTTNQGEREKTVSTEDTLVRCQQVSQERLDRMSKELEERMKSRKKFSRRRQHYDGEDVDYINDQNRLFNRKASKAFDKYTVEIRQNLERGTAL
uniref:Pre-mRNA-splicing factor SYF2 n=1 Tax=Albugo laibachii Nc14 TaxID=890382 RepID=F0WL11_9STRA|nr:premRNAsplicing factor syf2 putative [Albugo laibachii Nc14]|eukprot:CCA21970.1 premRNAsplicing factor syf2 putative [Albugo laibachii Nc14]